jgi:glycosyltransferase involved in cell wall biosynthesis
VYCAGPCDSYDVPRLLVIISDRLTALVDKGEVVPRYYNPGNLFDEVHILSTTHDQPAVERVRPMVGNAQLHLHRLPAGVALFLRTLGWRRPLLERWTRAGVELARAIKPDLVRCHGNFVNGALGAHVRQALGVPLVVSLHVNPEEDLRRLYHWVRDFPTRAALELHKSLERACLRAADAVICVYPYLAGYATRYGARRVELIYNVLQETSIAAKTDYALSAPPRVVIVGRQVVHKDPRVLVRAVAGIPGVELTLIGDGPLHQPLRRLADALGIGARTEFLPSVPNDKLCGMLASFDVFASVNSYGGVSKSVLEAMSAGLPLLANDRTAQTEPLVAGCGVFVPHAADGFREGLEQLLGDRRLRESLGAGAREAAARVGSVAMEAKVVDLYRSLLGVPASARA